MTPFDWVSVAASVLLLIIVLAVVAFTGKQERAAEAASYEREDEGELL
jgi:hypothetical protein